MANGYGADPAVGTDRYLMETDPYAVVEGTAIAAFAIRKPITVAAAEVQSNQIAAVVTSDPGPHCGNPIFEGWYADPEAAIFGNQYWIYPTYAAKYNQQVFFDAFSSPDLIHWTKHSRILDTNRVTWARRAMWAPAVAERNGKYYFFFGANDMITIARDLCIVLQVNPSKKKFNLFVGGSRGIKHRG